MLASLVKMIGEHYQIVKPLFLF